MKRRYPTASIQSFFEREANTPPQLDVLFELRAQQAPRRPLPEQSAVDQFRSDDPAPNQAIVQEPVPTAESPPNQPVLDQLDSDAAGLESDLPNVHAEVETHPDDTRPYIHYTPPGEHRIWYRCGCTRTNAQGEKEQCQYRKRGDRHIEALRKHKLHDCVFGPVSGPLDRMIDAMAAPSPSEMWDEIIHFAVQSNMSIEAAASESFRSVIHTAFQCGFRRALQRPIANVEEEFRAFCPQKRPTALRQLFIQVAGADRTKLEQPLVANKFAAMTMDAGQICATKFFMSNLVAAHLKCCFTSKITEIDATHNCKTLSAFLAAELHELAHMKRIHVSVIICDGAAYQTKALNWEDPASLQAAYPADPLLARVLFVPCLCHRLNNAYRRLVRDSRHFQLFISDLRRLAKFCRKPKWRSQLHGSCPDFVETRWLYDHRILQFVLTHEREINALHKDGREVTQLFHDFSSLLETWYELMTILEGSACRLSAAYNLISTATSRLTKLAAEYENCDISIAYKQAIDFINLYTLDSSSDILQLAYVLTPAGRQEAHEQLQLLLGSDIQDRPSFALEMVDFDCQLADHMIGEVSQLPDEDENDAPEPLADEVVETVSQSFYEDVTETFFLEVSPANSPSNYLAHRAQAALDRVIRQFQLTEEEKDMTERAFHHFITAIEPKVGVPVGFDRTRYLWLSAQIQHQEYSVLAEIALRLEPAICSEAPSERALGQQRRYLTPHRTRTKPDLLLARTEIEDYQHQSRNAQ
jgi:hypothetical protein